MKTIDLSMSIISTIFSQKFPEVCDQQQQYIEKDQCLMKHSVYRLK